MAVRVLNVAEKPSVAREVSRILSQGQSTSRPGRSRYNPVHEFRYTINGTPCDMYVTSVAGHLMEIQFDEAYRSWNAHPPRTLFQAPIHKQVPRDKKAIEGTLQREARNCQWLVLWLDCDREGENICFEVIETCCRANPRLSVFRARFSALIAEDLHRAISRLGAPNKFDADAVDVRQELDLRIGSAFTRFQTMFLEKKFEWPQTQKKLILSYGPCQFPTLGFIVERAWEIKSHVPEEFWSIQVQYTPPHSASGPVTFAWKRGRLFDHPIALRLYEVCLEKPDARVISVEGRETQRTPPVPLSTIELCKRASRWLRLGSAQVMQLAEELYQEGYISYPRTETDQFEEGYDLRKMISEQLNHPEWGEYCNRLLSNNLFKWPTPGRNNDQAHPPIHPTKPLGQNLNWNRQKASVYELVTRHFLACCSRPALGVETKVAITINEEIFQVRGLMVKERNYLDVYKYENWGGARALPVFEEGASFLPASIMLVDGKTQPPPPLSESDLLAKMEEHGIGTDATMAQHIQKQLERGYAVKTESSQSLMPTELGEALVTAYNEMGMEGLWRPTVRSIMEQEVRAVAMGNKTKAAVLASQVFQFENLFSEFLQHRGVFEAVISLFFRRKGLAPGNPGR
eukprot:scaffold529_cov322-Pavlova_lutheri.AAC.5